MMSHHNRPIRGYWALYNLTTMQVNASIFKAYDIRGVVPSTLNVEVAEALGRALGLTQLPMVKLLWPWAAMAA
jgi:phosphomannomutase